MLLAGSREQSLVSALDQKINLLYMQQDLQPAMQHLGVSIRCTAQQNTLVQ